MIRNRLILSKRCARTRIHQETPHSIGPSAFTLVEMLIVVLVLGIIAMLIVPQLKTSTDDAKVAVLRTNLRILRSAVERYYVEHNGTYPGERDFGKVSSPDVHDVRRAVVKQLTGYTDASGRASNTKSDRFKYGPYLKDGRFPANPFLHGNAAADVACFDYDDLSRRRVSTGTTGWAYWYKIGLVYANDGGATGGVPHADH